jgi:hypothetical protein
LAFHAGKLPKEMMAAGKTCASWPVIFADIIPGGKRAFGLFATLRKRPATYAVDADI